VTQFRLSFFGGSLSFRNCVNEFTKNYSPVAPIGALEFVQRRASNKSIVKPDYRDTDGNFYGCKTTTNRSPQRSSLRQQFMRDQSTQAPTYQASYRAESVSPNVGKSPNHQPTHVNPNARNSLKHNDACHSLEV